MAAMSQHKPHQTMAHRQTSRCTHHSPRQADPGLHESVKGLNPEILGTRSRACHRPRCQWARIAPRLGRQRYIPAREKPDTLVRPVRQLHSRARARNRPARVQPGQHADATRCASATRPSLARRRTSSRYGPTMPSIFSSPAAVHGCTYRPRCIPASSARSSISSPCNRLETAASTWSRLGGAIASAARLGMTVHEPGEYLHGLLRPQRRQRRTPLLHQA